MSIELCVFSTAPAEAEAVAAALARHGWAIRFETAEGFALGWCPAWADPPDESLELRHLPPDRYAGVGLSTRPADRQAMRALAFDEPRLAQPLASARHVHTVWTTAGRSGLAYALQLALWHAIAEATDGVLYNEMSGELLLAGEMSPEPAPASPEIPAGTVGSVAPDFSLLRQDGRHFSLSSYRGQPVTLWFVPTLDEAEADGLSRGQDLIKKRTVLVALGPFSSLEWEEWARFGLRFPLLADAHEVVQAYDGAQSRLTVVIGPDGIIRERFLREEGSPMELLSRLGDLQKKRRLW